MTEVLLAVWITALTFGIGILYLRIKKLNTALTHTLKALSNVLESMQMQSEINVSQQQMNEIINTNLEILGVHTSLIKPSIGFEATQFLNWYNMRRKEGNNGTL
jgi:hypothetical protein